MTRTIHLGWNAIYEQFFITDDSGGTNLPAVSAALLEDVDRWQNYLRENFEPHDDITGGRWEDGTRWWFAEEARRLEQEFRRQVPSPKGVVKVSPFPGIIQLRLFVDYNDWPLWDDYGGAGPESFPMLSDSLRDDLIAWAGSWMPKRGNPQGGERLAERVRGELGDEFEVTYCP